MNEQTLRAIHALACAAVARADSSLTPADDRFWPIYLTTALAQTGAVAPPGNPLYIYEYDSTFGVHRELQPITWNGQNPSRAVAFYAEPASSAQASSIEPSRLDDLSTNTANLIAQFSRALAGKLLAAQLKYGYVDDWMREGWGEECRAELMRHLSKGDPLDVAAYCAFLWHHNELTTSVCRDGNTSCNLGVGCESLGECFAAFHGKPQECGKRPVAVNARILDGDSRVVDTARLPLDADRHAAPQDSGPAGDA